jgi:sodium transport system permease protein
MNSPVWIIFRKETIDGLRDGRSLLSIFILLLFSPLVAVITIQSLTGQEQGRLVLPVVGAENAPTLISYLEQNGVEVQAAPKDAEAAVRDRSKKVVLLIPKKFGDEILRAETATLNLVVDSSRRDSQEAAKRLQRILSGYSQQLSLQRLLVRGVSAELLTPISVQSIELATKRSMAAMTLNMLSIFLVSALFMGGMNTATDTTTGERERGSLEFLLLRPVSKLKVTLGKWLATTLFSVMGLLASLLLLITIVGFLDLSHLGIFFSFGVVEFCLILVVLAPLALFASGLQMWVATFARNFKESQTNLMLVLILSITPGFVLYQTELSPWTVFIPILGQQQMISLVMEGQVPSILSFIGSMLGVLFCTAICIYATSRLLGREEIVLVR